MIDSIHIRLQTAQLTKQQTHKLLNVIAYKKAYDISRYFDDVQYRSKGVEGNYKNFKINIGSKTITLHGSLPEYIYGNNVQSLSFNQAIVAIKKLSEETGLPLFEGELQQVHIAECFVVSRIVQNYFASLEDTPGYIRSVDETKLKNGVRYLQGNMKLTFYDKTREALDVPAFRFDPNIEHVIRIEMRIKKNVRRTVFNRKTKFGVIYLMSHTFQNKLAQLWCDHYSAIIKRRLIYEHGKMDSAKYFYEYLITCAIHNLGLPQTRHKLAAVAIENKWTRSKKSKAIAELLRYYNSDLTSVPNKYIKELDSKVYGGQLYQYASKKK